MTSSLVSDVLAMLVRHQRPDGQASIGGRCLRTASATRVWGWSPCGRAVPRRPV